MDGGVPGMSATWVDATRVGMPSDFYYLAASPPLRLPELVRAAAASILQETSAKVRQGELR